MSKNVETQVQSKQPETELTASSDVITGPFIFGDYDAIVSSSRVPPKEKRQEIIKSGPQTPGQAPTKTRDTKGSFLFL